MPTHDSVEIEELSQTLSRLAAILGLAGGETYRNKNGVYMKLMNFRSADPEFVPDGKVALRGTGRGDIEVWNVFSSDPTRCAAAAAAIREELDAAGVDQTTAADDLDDDQEAEEGRLVTRRHRHRNETGI